MKKTILPLCSLLLASPLMGAWQAIDNLESETVGSEPSTGWSVFQEEGNFLESPTLTVVADPIGSGQGNVLEFDPGLPATTDSLNMTVERAIEESLQIVDPGTQTEYTTFYFKVLRPSVDGAPAEVDITWGLVAESARNTDTGLHGYGSYSLLGRYEINGIMDIRDGGSYVDLATEALNTDTYYEVWFVVDHFTNTSSQYIKGGSDYPVQTKVYEGAGYRNETFDNLDTILFITSAGNTDAPKGKDPIYFDDFYIDVDGENLDSPGGDSGSELVNISTRGNVIGTRNIDGLNGSFVIGGTDSKTVLIRAAGPALGALGVAGSLEDPKLTVIKLADGSTAGENDNWSGADVEAAGLAVSPDFTFAEGSNDAAVLLTLEPGSYSALVTTDGAAGLALVEIYEVN